MARVPILAYHSMNISGDAYASNDHAALAEDLALLARGGITVVPLALVVDALLAERLHQLDRCVAITFDDGSNFDHFDLPHPAWGVQKAMSAILREAPRAGAPPTATSFVIVSPDAREQLDRSCMIGRRWWTDDWWAAAEADGVLRIESHSWDHNHDSLASTVAAAPKGSFDLTCESDADGEIAGANDYLCARRGRAGPVLFAYPYGVASEFLCRDYFPRRFPSHGVRAAFTTDGAPVAADTDRWRIPRYVCGLHWRSPGALERIVDECWR